ncbi:lipopolysaccharide biosynthesis protein [Motilibacter aurantiacus]|uniref:lipopolysaccharide biosynthesis protein n=1 Tax=Motilibacter aurantiacus TaxID=2714955 RepID=UPI00140B2810|nr:oligosaccharide flippase family protein [Motilibacter aurantiacus]NHC44734.1 oligosaccharide flippase family protein [Motilibacter aurantiacus]
MSRHRLEAVPPGLEASAGTGRERWRRIVLAALGAAGFRAATTVGAFVTLPLVLGSLGEARNGLLVLVTSLPALLVFSDFGFGNGLVTPLSRAVARGDTDEARGLISSAWVLLLSVAAGIGGLLLLAWPFVPWASVLGVDGLAGEEAPEALAVFAVVFLAGLPVSLAGRIHLALQEGLQTNLWQLAGALGSIAATLLCVAAEAGVPAFVAAALAGPVVASAVNCAWLFARRPHLRPRLSAVRSASLRYLLHSGGLFLVLGVAGAVAYQTDALVVAHLLGPAEVTSYYIAQRLFLLPTIVVSFALTPLWPAFSDAFARGEVSWARRTLRQAVLVAAAVNVTGAAVLLLASSQILDLWIGDRASVPLSLLVACALWTANNTLVGPFAMLLNGAHVVRFQVVCALVMAAVNLPLSVALTHAFGVSGPIWGSLVAQTLCITVPILVYMPRVWRRMSVADAGRVAEPVGAA